MSSSPSSRLLSLGLSLTLALLLCVCVSARSLGKHHPPYPPPPPYPGGVYSYGRAFGNVAAFFPKDVGSSHHLELNFSAIADLDSGASYTNFQANMNVRSNDGSDVLVAVVNGSALAKAASVMSALQGAPGVKKLHASEGIAYRAFLTAASFAPMSEDAVLALYAATIKIAAPGQVYVFGQVYSDSNGAHGIHDVHRIVADNGAYRDYGDGAFIVRDVKGNYYGVFLHFDNQKPAAAY